MFRWYPADRLFYYPTVKTYESPESSGLAAEPVYFQSADRVRLHGLFFPAAESPRGTVLHFHGNAGNVTGHWPFIAWLPPAGWNVLCFDYRGFGCSQGRISQRGSVLDVHAALDYVLSRPDVDPARVVAFGQSLGGAVAVVVG
ncbi:MAG: alpha/beta hydrolase, partial [Phycisphaerales bacterium]